MAGTRVILKTHYVKAELTLKISSFQSSAIFSFIETFARIRTKYLLLVRSYLIPSLNSSSNNISYIIMKYVVFVSLNSFKMKVVQKTFFIWPFLLMSTNATAPPPAQGMYDHLQNQI